MNTEQARVNHIVDKIVDLLERDDWKFSSYTATCVSIPSIQIWMANLPVLDTNTYPVALPIGIINKFRIWRALKKAKAFHVLNLMERMKK